MPATPLVGQDIIDQFETYTDDTTELSSPQELTLVNKIYRKILASHTWIFLIKTFSGSINYDGTNYYINLPSDFNYMPITSGSTDTGDYGLDKTIYCGPNNQPYKVVNFTDKRQYTNMDGYVYIDIANSKIVFTGITPWTSTSFDYVYSPADITLNTSPIFPADYHQMIFHGMVVDDVMIQLFDKFRSYAQENQGAFDSYMDDLSNWNSQFYSQ